MGKQAQTLFLEEWLRSNSGTICSKHSSSSSARAIIQAWADLRNSLEHNAFHPHHLQSLKTLTNSQISLYVADPQAKLLLSILSAPNLSLPHEACPFFFRLLYIWVRKSSKPSLVLIDSAVEVLSNLFSAPFDSTNKSSFFFSEGVLLLGALPFVPALSEKSKNVCFELLCRLLEEEYQIIGSSEENIPNVLAGIGYALFSSGSIHFVQILDHLFGIWDKVDVVCSSVSHGLMILHLIEWLLSGLVNSISLEKIDGFSREVLETSKPNYAPFAVVMAAAGVLRAFNRSVGGGLGQIRKFAEKRIEILARDLISKTHENRLLLQCISLALARSGSVSSRAPLLICLATALLTEIFPLQSFYTRLFRQSHDNFAALGLNEVKNHLNSAFFKEAGAITGVFCSQYVSADEENKNIVENLIWGYCQSVYSGHRRVALILRGGEEDELLGSLEKIAEAAFLMVVVFALAVTKQKLDSKISRETQIAVSVKILVSFSCMEYFRRMRLPEYMDTIRVVVASVQENELACISFVESMPSYADLTNQQGLSSLQTVEYMWSKDEVQTARFLFYLRVIPTCIDRLPADVFTKVVAPAMFLYMGHPNAKVARCSHSMFAAFVSSGKDSNEDERNLLKEQLVYYYMQRSLEGYPGITPFEGMASGVATLARYLPAGSPSTFYCIQSLGEKANNLCSEVMTQEANLWNSRQGELEPCKKILELLLRLLSLVDIQVLPSLMKLLAQLIVRLPKDGQNTILDELYAQVAESDDVTRKPMLVSWLQSLSYLCSQETRKSTAPAWINDPLSLERISARL